MLALYAVLGPQYCKQKKEGRKRDKEGGEGNSFGLRVVKGTVEADGTSNGSPRYAGDLEKDGSGWPWADQGSRASISAAAPADCC